MNISPKIAVYQNILEILRTLNISFEEIDHPPVTSCADSAKYRTEYGWTGIGSKNILFHAKGKFYLVVTTADKEIKARIFKKEFRTKNIRFATPDEVRKVTECEIGALPPFGYLNPDLPIYVDNEIFDNDYFMFNPAIHTKSVRLKTDDLKRIYQYIKNPVKIFIHINAQTNFVNMRGE